MIFHDRFIAVFDAVPICRPEKSLASNHWQTEISLDSLCFIQMIQFFFAIYIELDYSEVIPHFVDIIFCKLVNYLTSLFKKLCHSH